MNNKIKTMKSIIEIVSNYYNVDIYQNTRKRKIVFPRQVAMSLVNHYTKLGLQEIGDEFNRDHATVIHACRLIKNELSYNIDFLKEYNLLLDKIKIELNLDIGGFTTKDKVIIEIYRKLEILDLKQLYDIKDNLNNYKPFFTNETITIS